LRKEESKRKVERERQRKKGEQKIRIERKERNKKDV
jgi:hypothetical protein